MKKIVKGKIIPLVVLLFAVFFSLTACTTGNKEDSSKSLTSDFVFNQTEPQYYMNQNSAAAENGYYYITGDVVSDDDLKYLYFYDIGAKHQYPVCSKLTCEHHDETCDAHRILDNILGNAIWYYDNRLYMVEKAEEYDRIISYDLQGRDRQNHTVLSAAGISVWEGKISDSITFNDGYVYYISLTNPYEPVLYRAGIAEKSSPELIHKFDNSNGDFPTFTLSALPGRVYVNLSLKSHTTDISNYCLDYYDTQTGTYTEVFKTDSETGSENGKIVAWHRGEYDKTILFDDKHNMYYATTTDTEYMVNKLNTDTGKIEKIYTISGEMYTKKGMVSTGDEYYIKLESFDGRYLYISQTVNPNKAIKDFKETAIAYGSGRVLTTQVSTSYIYVLDTAGNCADIFSFKRGGFVRPNGLSQNGSLRPKFLCGDSRYLLISCEEVEIEGLELTNKEYLAKIEEINKAIWANHTGSLHKSVQASLDKSQIGSETHEWLNIVN